jgi:hypothetical protein
MSRIHSENLAAQPHPKREKQMKKFMSIVVVSVAFAGIAGAAELSDTATGTATATVITPIAVVAGNDLRFGTFSVDATNGGTVSIAANGARTATASYIDLVTSTIGAATFDVSGQASTTYAYTVANATLSNGTPADDMAATLQGVSTSTANGSSGTLTAGGTDTITVFGSLAVAAGQTEDSYSGDFDVTVAYN